MSITAKEARELAKAVAVEDELANAYAAIQQAAELGEMDCDIIVPSRPVTRRLFEDGFTVSPGGIIGYVSVGW